MGLKERLKGKKVYLDSNIFIYILEGFPQYEALVNELIEGIENNQFYCFSSELTLAELLVPAFREENSAIISQYKHILNDPAFVKLIPTTQDIYIYSASNRAHHNLKLPDAIHVATAQLSKYDVFLTNDKKIKAPKSIEVIILDNLIDKSC